MAYRCRFLLLLISLAVVFPMARAQSNAGTDPLVRVLQEKGVLTEAEARAITANASTAEQRDRLATLLRDKGVISPAEFEAVRTNPALPVARTIPADYRTTSPIPRAAAPQPTPPK